VLPARERADPRAADPYFVLGETLWQLGRLPEAVGAWQEAARETRRLAPAGFPRLPPRRRYRRDAAERVLSLATCAPG
jgi:hypothetical protein